MPSAKECSYGIRGIASRKEVLAVADLYGKAFGNYPRLYPNYLDLLLKRMPREQWRLSRTVWAHDGAPIAHIRIADRTMTLGAARVRVAGIGDVCTHPFRRKRGLMRTLFAHVNQFMREERYDLSLLWGIPNFYDKFGFIVALSQEWFTVPRQQVARLEAPYKGRRSRRTDAEAILKLFRDDLACRDGAMDRWGDAWLRRLVREKWCRILEDDRGRPRAYYRGSPRDDGTFAVTEVSLGPRPDGGSPRAAGPNAAGIRRAAGRQSPAAVVSVLADAAKMAAACEKGKVRFDLPVEHPIGQFCFADGCESTRQGWHRGGGMARIANLESLCQRMAPEWERLLASSPVADWTGRLRLKTDIGTVDLAIARGYVKAEPPSGRASAVLAADQDKLCRLVVGYHTPATAALLGEARISREAMPLAAALFPRRSLAIFPGDRF